MDDVRVGAAFRAVRIRSDWRQGDVAVKAKTTAGVVSLIERGHLEAVSTRVLRRVAIALGIKLDITLGCRMVNSSG